MVIVTITWTSDQPQAQFEQRSRDSVPGFRALEGLQQKYFVKAAEGAAVGGVYVFETKAAARAYLDSPRVKALADRVGPEAGFTTQMFDVLLTLDDQPEGAF